MGTLKRNRHYRVIDVNVWKYKRKMMWGLRGGEWWIGARRNFMMGSFEINIFGLTLFISNERWPND